MRVAGSTLLYSRLPLDEACRRLSERGFDAVDVGMQEEWAHADPSEAVGAVDEVRRRIEAACAAADLDPVAINASAGEVNIDTETERVEAVADIADALGVGVMTLPAAPTETPLADDLDRFRTLTDAVEDRDVTLTVETHWGTHAEDPDAAAEYAAAVPGLGYTLDPGHYAIGDHDPHLSYDRLLPHVEHAHVRQAGSGWAEIQQPVEEGRIDVEAFVADLRTAGYDGAITVEYIDALDDVDPEVAQSQAEAMRTTLLRSLRGP